MPLSDLATAALGGGVVGGFIAGSIARLTERDKGIRETMIAQADAVSKHAKSLIVRLEAFKRDRGSTDVLCLRRDFATLQDEVAGLHVLFHRQVYSRAEQVVTHIQAALDDLARDEAQGVARERTIQAAADELDVWCECAGADARRPSGVWRYDRFASRRFSKHERRVLGRQGRPGFG